MATLITKLTSTPGTPPTYNVGMAETFSWIPIGGAGRPLYARASYITNFEDFTISLSAAELNIESITIKDGNSGRIADVEDAGNGLNGLRVVTQDLEPQHDTVSLADIGGNNVSVTSSTSSLNVHVTNSLSATIDTTGTKFPISFPKVSVDAFNRLRTSSPITLFDSSHRYQDNNLWSTLSSNGGSISFNANQGLVNLNTSTSSGSEVIRETTKVFSYQPGKSLISMNTFVFSPSSIGLRQRVGYFGSSNGFYLELEGPSINLVKRTSINGTIQEVKISQSEWNEDRLDGTGPSKKKLDITKAQILWCDLEWLGVGTVRTGFAIDGEFIICHSFHHANLLNSTYITTACLPIRYEITNTGTTSTSNTLKQICSTVISEGGYELRGEQKQVSIPITSPYTLTTAGIFYPVISLRLKSSPNRLDGIVILSNLSIMGLGNGINFQWRLVARSTTSGGTWISVGNDSCVEYNITGTSSTTGKVLASGYFNSSNQSAPTITIPKTDLFKFQLERNSLTSTPYELSLQLTSGTANNSVFASLEWEEITR